MGEYIHMKSGSSLKKNGKPITLHHCFTEYGNGRGRSIHLSRFISIDVVASARRRCCIRRAWPSTCCRTSTRASIRSSTRSCPRTFAAPCGGAGSGWPPTAAACVWPAVRPGPAAGGRRPDDPNAPSGAGASNRYGRLRLSSTTLVGLQADGVHISGQRDDRFRSFSVLRNFYFHRWFDATARAFVDSESIILISVQSDIVETNIHFCKLMVSTTGGAYYDRISKIRPNSSHFRRFSVLRNFYFHRWFDATARALFRRLRFYIILISIQPDIVETNVHFCNALRHQSSPQHQQEPLQQQREQLQQQRRQAVVGDQSPCCQCRYSLHEVNGGPARSARPTVPHSSAVAAKTATGTTIHVKKETNKLLRLC